MTKERLTIIFNAWNKKYAQDPGKYTSTLDENGVPYEGYGESAASDFLEIEKELESKGQLSE